LSCRVGRAVLLAVLSVELYVLHVQGRWPVAIRPDYTLWQFLASVTAVLAFYQVMAAAIVVFVRRHAGPDGEITMLTGFVRLLTGLGVLLAFTYATGVLRAISVVAAGFVGMLFGFSLQAPMSGLVAWLMITLMRPFRISDRVQFPSLGLTGDVKRVGLMYTILDQVGGTIGSEDPIGRDVMIPNAMLFSQVAINYTVRTRSAYFLDEVVVRLTYDSDWDTAENILLNAARSVTSEIIAATGQEPYVRSDIWDYGILMRLRYMTKAKDRPRITHEIVKTIFKDIQRNPRVDMAIPFVYSYRKGSAATERRHFPGPPETVIEVAVEQIADPVLAPGTEPDETEIQALMQSIREQGLLQPIVVEARPDGRYAVVAGEVRFLACKRLGWRAVPVVVRDRD